jgi:hypothetical protein
MNPLDSDSADKGVSNMKEIYIMTFHTPKNYGAVLQAFSLLSFLKNSEMYAKIIDYNTPHLRSIYTIVPRVHDLKTALLAVVLLPTYRHKKRKYIKFDEFINQKFILSKRYESTEALYQESWGDCLFITGSDQVFSPKRIQDERKAFYLDFVPERCKRIAYAASFGGDSIPKSMQQEVAGYLKKFDYLSAREVSGKRIIEKLSEKSAETVLDPVFLNDELFWHKHEKKYDIGSAHFLLYYRLLGEGNSDSIAKEIAKRKGLDLIIVTDGFLVSNGAKVLRDVGPDELLFIFNKADFVVTDSFHGTAFSIIYKKQFVFCNENDVSNQRGIDLLKKLGLEQVAYSKNFELKQLIAYEAVQNNLAEQIEKSRNYLLDAIRSCGGA